jgi:hypothetical protein
VVVIALHDHRAHELPWTPTHQLQLSRTVY